MKRFRGRVITPGTVKATALVSRDEVDTLASFGRALRVGDKGLTCGDRNNEDLFGKAMAGKALCLPRTVGSATGSLMLYCACATNRQPACLLFSQSIDTVAAGGSILAAVWLENTQMPVIDNLGAAFLRYVEDGMTVTLEGDGIVRVV